MPRKYRKGNYSKNHLPFSIPIKSPSNELIGEIKSSYGFTDTFDLYDEVIKIVHLAFKIDNDNPRSSDIRKHVGELVAALEILLNELSKANSQFKKSINANAEYVYKFATSNNQLSLVHLLENECKILLNLCTSLKTNEKFITTIKTFLHWLDAGTKIKMELNLQSAFKNKHKKTLIPEIIHNLKLLQSACNTIISTATDKGGQFDTITRNIVLHLAGLFFRETGNRPIIYNTELNDNTHGGKFYQFLLDCNENIIRFGQSTQIGDIGMSALEQEVIAGNPTKFKELFT